MTKRQDRLEAFGGACRSREHHIQQSVHSSTFLLACISKHLLSWVALCGNVELGQQQCTVDSFEESVAGARHKSIQTCTNKQTIAVLVLLSVID